MGLVKDLKKIKQVIIATDDTIKDIVESEIKRLGNNADLNHINVSQVTDMSDLFADSDFNGDISCWDVSNVKDMKDMLENCPLEKNLPKWYK